MSGYDPEQKQSAHHVIRSEPIRNPDERPGGTFNNDQMRTQGLQTIGKLMTWRFNGRHIEVLALLSGAREPTQVRDIASNLSIPASAVTRTLQRLVRVGLVARTARGRDHRDAPVALTLAGFTFVRSLAGAFLSEGGCQRESSAIDKVRPDLPFKAARPPECSVAPL